MNPTSSLSHLTYITTSTPQHPHPPPPTPITPHPPPPSPPTPKQDLIRLSHLNEPSVLAALDARYAAGDIYTNTGGSIIIAINPFQPMTHLYDGAAMESYRGQGADGDNGGGGRAPHVFGVASQAYWRMRREGKGQALLVGWVGRA